MPTTPDRFPGPREDEELILETNAPDPTTAGAIRYNGSAFRARDATGVFDVRSGSGISEAQHEVLDTLTHLLAETCYTEITRSGGRVTDVITWTTSGKTTKVREVNLTRSGGQISSIVVKQYDGAGTLDKTLTGTVTRSSGQIANIDWVKT